MAMVSVHFESKKFAYDGRQLAALFAYQKFGLSGDSVVAWRGPCEVLNENIVDAEDLVAHQQIKGSDMIHFIFESFSWSLAAMVAGQRVMAGIVKDFLINQSENKALREIFRQGDDLFWGDKKLSISVATTSGVSTLMHFAVNVSNEGTPVSTCSLKDFGVDPDFFGKEILKLCQSEFSSITKATQKVFPVGSYQLTK